MEHFAGYKMSALVERAGFNPKLDSPSRLRNFSVKPHERISQSVLTATVSGNVETCCDRVLPPCYLTGA